MRAARLLAEFLDLQDGDIKGFLNQHQDFLLAWHHAKSLQQDLLTLWKHKFPQKEVLRIFGRHDMSNPGVVELTPSTVTTTVRDAHGTERTITRTVEDIEAGLTYKNAVLFLFTEPWRAKTCDGCDKHFIREKAGTNYHSPKCFAQHRREYQSKK